MLSKVSTSPESKDDSLGETVDDTMVLSDLVAMVVMFLIEPSKLKVGSPAKLDAADGINFDIDEFEVLLLEASATGTL